VCGAPLVGDPVPFHHPRHYPGMPDPGPDPPPVDLFAGWTSGAACSCSPVIPAASRCYRRRGGYQFSAGQCFDCQSPITLPSLSVK